MLEELRIASSKRVRRNEEIEAAEVRVIDAEGEQAGVMPLSEIGRASCRERV